MSGDLQRNLDRIDRIKRLHPHDVSALVYGLGATDYVADGAAPALLAADLAFWADRKGRESELDDALTRLETNGPAPRSSVDIKPYLQWLRDETAHIDIRGLQVGSGKANRFTIEDLFIPLTTTMAAEQDADGELAPAGERHMSPRALHLALQSRTLVIVGDPGAGKSTFLRFVAKTLCDAWIEETSDLVVARLGYLSRPFPILLRVADLTEHVRTCRARNEGPSLGPYSPSWLAHCLACAADMNGWALDEAFFRKQMADGDTLVMLDGLDEAPSRTAREEIGEMVRRAANACRRCRFAITTRPAAYVETTVVPGFDQARIESLPDSSIDSFLKHWCSALFSGNPLQGRKHQHDLANAIRSRKDIRRLARNPVMLTALAVVHWNEKRLPEQRAELYQSIMTWLARARERKPGRAPDKWALELLQNLALAMQDSKPARVIQVSRRWAAECLASNWPGESEEHQIAKADSFLIEEELDSGIVVRRGNELRFWHLTFQEYLAARALAASGEKRQKEILLGHPLKLHSTEWRETVLLFAGILRDQGVEKADGMVACILNCLSDRVSLSDSARTAGLLGAVVRDLAPFQFRPSDTRYKNLMDNVLAVFDCERSVQVPIRDAIAAAEALGLSGDPRFVRSRPLNPWVDVPAGEFTMGAQGTSPGAPNFDVEAVPDEGPTHCVHLGEFSIGKYPVTVCEYQEFVDSDGYADVSYWSQGGHRQWAAPDEWDEQREHPTRPVVGVSWFEAVAFAAWRGCRLPTEAEWERAARGIYGRRFPWGAESGDAERMNFMENVGCPTPVGVYPRGGTPEGVQDMAGNVWEWCWDGKRDYTVDTQINPIGPMNKSAERIARGGGYWFCSWWCRSAFRDWYEPFARVRCLGFRLAACRETGVRQQEGRGTRPPPGGPSSRHPGSRPT